MRHIYSKLLMAAALLLTASAASAETLALYDDATGKNNQLPINFYYTSNAVHSQMIYPEADLTAIKGKVIEKVSFTMVQAGTLLKNPGITLKMGTTQQSEYTTATYIESGLTEVAKTAIEELSSSTTVPYIWEITLEKPFTYTSGNLVLDFTNEKGTANGRTWNFKCKPQDVNTAVSKAGTDQLVKFLPAIKIEYSDPAVTSATASATAINFPMVFMGEKSEQKVTLTNTGTETLSGTVTIEGSDAFTVSPVAVSGLGEGESTEYTVTFNPMAAGHLSARLVFSIPGIDMDADGVDEPIVVDLAGLAVDAPEAVRTLFNEDYYAGVAPAGWNTYAEEWLTADNSFSDGTTEYDDFGTTLRFESAKVAGYDAILWNHANPMPYSDIYTRYYYLVSPMVGGKIVLGASLYDDVATGASVRAFEAKYDEEKHIFNIGDEIELTWDTTPAQGEWSIASGNTSPSTQVALLIKYAAVNFFAADNQKKEDGISNIASDNANAPVEYFDLRGVAVKGQPASGLYIRRQGTEVTKVIVR